MTKPANNQDRLEALIKELKSQKQLKNAHITLGSDPDLKQETLSFGIAELDELCKGMVRGGYTIFYGPEKSGKSAAMLKALAQMQTAGLHPALLDLEERFDPEWAAIQGVDLDNLTLIQMAGDLEEALTIAEVGIENDLFTALAVDSVTAKSARGELEDKSGKKRNISEETVAIMARLWSKWFRRISHLTKSKKVPALLLAQVRTTNISSGAFLDITGGLALKHYASTIVKMSRTEKISMTREGEKRELGYWMQAELKKTSLCANETQKIRVPFYFGIGIDDIAAAVRAGINLGLITNLTKGVEFNGKKYVSEPAFVEKLRDNSELKSLLLEKVALLSGDAIQPSDENKTEEKEEQDQSS